MSKYNIEDVKTDIYTLDSISLRSIAISLKRIADKLELSQKQPVIMAAEEYAKYENDLARTAIIEELEKALK